MILHYRVFENGTTLERLRTQIKMMKYIVSLWTISLPVQIRDVIQIEVLMLQYFYFINDNNNNNMYFNPSYDIVYLVYFIFNTFHYIILRILTLLYEAVSSAARRSTCLIVFENPRRNFPIQEFNESDDSFIGRLVYGQADW